MSRILLADDHPMIRTAMEALLRGTDFDIVATSATGEETLKEIARVKPDLLLLDLQMPGGTGMDVIRRSVPTAPRSDRPADRRDRRCLAARSQSAGRARAGAQELRPGLSARLPRTGEPGDPGSIPSFSSGRGIHGTLAAGPRPALSPRERQLIRLVRKGLGNREIAEQLGVTEGTVKVYLHAVFEKLGVSSRTELAIRADEFLAGSYLKD